MWLYNTADPDYIRPLEHCVMNALAPGKGLYMPCTMPRLSDAFLHEMFQFSFVELANELAKALIGERIPSQDLERMVKESMNFPVIMTPLGDRISSLELWHGPSLAFKDFGARFMAALMSYYHQNTEKPLTILVATSGDTGGAVAYGFLDVPGIEVIILYPKGKVSPLQELQLTTLGSNITACEIKGSFDDCQTLVKEAFTDKTLVPYYHLNSANSINIARLIPQTFYYFEAYRQLSPHKLPVICSVPSGNFGNLTAGLLARQMGLPIQHFMAATNVNDVVPQYLESGIFTPKSSVPTLSNAMDVGNPSNFIRLLELFDHDVSKFREVVSGFSVTDDETRSEMEYVYQTFGYVTDPHGAIAHRALRHYLADHDGIGFFLETAHPAKFKELVEEVLDVTIDVPERLATLVSQNKLSFPLDANYTEFKHFLMERHKKVI